MALEDVIILGVAPDVGVDAAGRSALASEVGRATAAGLKVLIVLPGDRASIERAERAAGLVAAAGGPAARAEAYGRELAASADAFADQLEAIGISAIRLDPTEVGPVTRGNPMEAQPRRVSARAIALSFEDASVVVLPGEVGRDESGGLSLLGSGGPSLAATFIAERLALPMHWYVGPAGADLPLVRKAGGNEDASHWGGAEHVVDVPGSMTPEHALAEAGLSRRAMLYARAMRVPVVPVALGLVDSAAYLGRPGRGGGGAVRGGAVCLSA